MKNESCVLFRKKKKVHSKSIYERHIKRLFDVAFSILFIVCFWWIFILVAVLVRNYLGTPILFVQLRPGKNEKVFKIYKFRTMTNERNRDGSVLPDEERLTSFGKWLRRTSLDELPEIYNVLKGDMSIIGPRPQLVKDLTFMTEEQRKRHTVMPGLSGLAQVNGRNAISWEEKFEWDLKYIEKITFLRDMRIILQTIFKAFFKQEGIVEEGMATAEDLGDYLLNKGKIDQRMYDERQRMAKLLSIKETNNLFC